MAGGVPATTSMGVHELTSVPDPGDGGYPLTPTFPRSKRPQGWVYIRPITGRTVRRITPGYLNQRMPSSNTIAMNQNYVEKILGNPRTPRENREAVIGYILDNPSKFTPLADETDDPEHNEWARKKNGNAKHGFMREFRRRYSE